MPPDNLPADWPLLKAAPGAALLLFITNPSVHVVFYIALVAHLF
jgi:hypothetical protein